MKPGARLAAAAEILEQIFVRRSAADRTLTDWGRANRYAGSKDRAAIAERVYLVLRRRNECARAAGSESVRACILGSLRVGDGLSVEEIDQICTDGVHALGALTSTERHQLSQNTEPATPWDRLNYPNWLHGELMEAFGSKLERELAALNSRAPLDLRVNELKASLDEVLAELRSAGCDLETQHGAFVRLAAGSDKKIQQLPAYIEGRIEVQDRSSQMAVDFSHAQAGQTVIDLAAGAGGKSLALAAKMRNKGRIIACDVEPRRLDVLSRRAARASASIVEAFGDPYDPKLTSALGGKADIVFVDAPCSGSGTWRRNPETKWTLSPERLEGFCEAQRQLLSRARTLVRQGGTVIYAVCSVLPCEGRLQMSNFLSNNQEYRQTGELFLTPCHDGTDGFFAARLQFGS